MVPWSGAEPTTTRYVERVANIHVHTTFSDGTASHHDLSRHARSAGVDVVLCADHNAWPKAEEGWRNGCLILVGEEVHNPASPLENHLLVFGAGASMAPYATDPQLLIDAAIAHGGIAFLAHPYEHSGAYAGEPEINWNRWDVTGYCGIELWNYMSEFKSYARSLVSSIAAILSPRRFIRGPYPETLRRWQRLLEGRPVIAIAGSDAHAGCYGPGPLKLRVLPYRHLMRALNTHLLLTSDWSGDAEHDAKLVYDALGAGRAFLAYDALDPATGFRFSVESVHGTATIGEALIASNRMRLQAYTPSKARIALLRNGSIMAETYGQMLSLKLQQPGRYHIEAFRRVAGAWRHWIISNPIRVLVR